MPNRWPISSGNWSNAAIWSGSLIPTASDDVFANNFTVDIDTSFRVLTLKNSASASAVVAGGSFRFNSGSISGSITSTTPLEYGANNLIQVTATSGTVSLNFGGDVLSRELTNSVVLLHTGSCDLVITGSNFTGASAGGTNYTTLISKSSTGNLIIIGNLAASIGGSNFDGSNRVLTVTAGNATVIGNVTGGRVTSPPVNPLNDCIIFSGNTLTVNGNVQGGTGSEHFGIRITGASSRVIVNGNVVGGYVSNGAGISSTVTSTIIITGSVIAAAASLAPAISTTGIAQITVSGSVATLGNVNAILSTGVTQINIIGTVSASAITNAISATSATSRVNLTGNMLNVNGKMAIYAPTLFISNTTPTTANFSITGGNSKAFYSEDVPSNVPSASNVRSGTTYSGSLVGTITMPSSSDVRSGVTYDANNSVTGSAIVTTNLLLNEISSSSSPVAVRIRNAATPEILGELMEAFKK